MERSCLCLLLLLPAVLAYDAWVLTPPQSVELHPKEAITSGKDFLALAEGILGVTSETCSWPGISLKSPFGAASSLVLLSVHSDYAFTPIFDFGKNGVRIPIKRDLDWRGITQSLDVTLTSKFGEEAQIRTFEGVSSDMLGPGPAIRSLNSSAFPDSFFLNEIRSLKDIPDQLDSLAAVSVSKTPNVLVAEVHSLGLLELEHGKNSPQVKEAVELLKESIQSLDADLSRSGSTLITVSGDEKLARNRRQARADTDDAEWRATFNIMLWFTVAMAIALLYISVGIGSMDPGRDSIIYRMTSTRMKKDN